MSEVFSFDQMLNANGTRFATVDCHGGTLRLGTLSSGDMISWLRVNSSQGEEGKFAGLDLLVRSIVDEGGARVPEERRAEFIESFKNKDSADNRKAIRAARDLNGLNELAKQAEALGNASGEVKTDASPSDSPATSVE